MPELAAEDQALLDGVHGPAAAHAMRLLLGYGRALGAAHFLPITSAHIDGCLYHGPSSLAFVRRFAELGGRVRVPTTLNVAAVDLGCPELYPQQSGMVSAQAELIALHEDLGCLPTLTCAPYQRMVRPRPGEHVAWAESNAIVFANSVLGARTDRYGDFTDLCAALTGRVPALGLHLADNRRPTLALQVPDPDAMAMPRDLAFAAIGYALGLQAGSQVAAIIGIGQANEDELKALGTAAATSGAVALFHAVGITPEAPSRQEASTLPRKAITEAELAQLVDRLCPVVAGEPVAAVCLGTPHYSLTEFRALARLLEGLAIAPGTRLILSTSREIAAMVAADPGCAAIAASGARILTDTCSYVTPSTLAGPGVLLTSSAKWAHYAPATLGRRAGLMDLARCLRCAAAGMVVP